MQYPLMFDTEPQWDIYTPGIEIVDPSGVQSTGLPFYKQLFWGLRFFRSVAFESATMGSRIVYDWEKACVRALLE